MCVVHLDFGSSVFCKHCLRTKVEAPTLYLKKNQQLLILGEKIFTDKLNM
jgi:hypothetical protein